MGARREVLSAVAERYRSAGRVVKGAHPRRVVPDDGLASQACGEGVAAARRRGDSQDGLVHPDSDDGGRCHRMDRVPAAGQSDGSLVVEAIKRAQSSFLGCCAVSTSTTTVRS
jgi:hypothetical protein